MATDTVKRETEDSLRGLAAGDVEVLESLLALQFENLEASGLDPKSYSLAKIAALIALDAPPASFIAQVAFALDAGATPEDILGVAVAIAPQVGMPKIVGAAPEIMLALGLALDDE